MITKFIRRNVPVLIAFVACGVSDVRAELDYSPYQRVLEMFVDENGHVEYEALSKKSGDLRIFTTTLSNKSPRSHPDAFNKYSDRLAYWINAYNALVLSGVVSAYPVESVKAIREQMGFFSQMYFTVGGQRLSLNDIEHEILRKEFTDPRIHAAINCASISCPGLSRSVYRPEILESQLEHAMETFVAEHVQLDREHQEVTLSKIFDWFGEDFAGWYQNDKGVKKAHILDYVGLYLKMADRQFTNGSKRPSIRYSAYNWKLNDLQRGGD